MNYFRLFPVPGSSNDNRYALGAYDQYGRTTLYKNYIGKIETSIGQDIHEFYTDDTKSSKIYVVSDAKSIKHEGQEIENKSNKDYKLYQAYLESTYQSQREYVGSDANEFIWAPDQGYAPGAPIDVKAKNQNIYHTNMKMLQKLDIHMDIILV